MAPFAERSALVDVHYLDEPGRIACGVLETDEGLLLVDPGPAVSLENLMYGLKQAGAGLEDVTAVLLTHIHLDHAGATGSIVARRPSVKVFVHERGAVHMVEPEKLLRSAERLYGDQMGALWGEFLAVPRDNVHALIGGEKLVFGARRLEVHATPGHAVHHVTFLELSAGTAFVGDTAGMKIPGVPYVLPVAPPPDIQVDTWMRSLDLVRSLQAERLFLTHFGPSEDVTWHLDHMVSELEAWATMVHDSLSEAGTDEERARRFEEEVHDRLPSGVSPHAEETYQMFGQAVPSWYGLARYWRKKLEAEELGG